MDVLWLSTRKCEDLSSSSQQGIITALDGAGVEVTFVGPTSNGNQQFSNCKHIQLTQQQIWGRRTSSFAKKVKLWLHHHIANFQVILVEWPLVHYLQSILRQTRQPIILIDRSPPADQTILAKFQWRHWKEAWMEVEKGNFVAGTVVSHVHRQFIWSKLVSEPKCIEIKAGVQQISSTPVEYTKPVKMVYHGRLDKHRGISYLIELSKQADLLNILHTLTFYGDGNALTIIERCESDSVIYGGKLGHEEMIDTLKQHHVGLLPMPPNEVWVTASPLKQSEYLAAGLPILGISHPGHFLE